jgi:hypothetical protein
VAHHICGIIDLEYFCHKTFFRVRELGFISCANDDATPINIQFDTFINRSTLEPNVIRTFQYQRDRVHGLSFRPGRDILQTLPHYCLPQIVRLLYESHRTPDRYYLAHKGGEREIQLCQMLKIPHYNLEQFPDCPSRPALTILDSCGHHVFCNSGYLHCATSEVSFYQRWLRSVFH